MSEKLLEKINEDASFLENLVFSDESTFYLNGCVNIHNCRIWGKEPPKEKLDKVHSSPKVNVWMAMSATTVYGPFFIDGNVNADNYLHMLQTCFYDRLSDKTRGKLFFSKTEHQLIFQEKSETF